MNLLQILWSLLTFRWLRRKKRSAQLQEAAQTALAAARQLANKLIEMPERQKAGELQLLKLRNHVLYSLVQDELRKIREAAAEDRTQIQAAIIEGMLHEGPGVVDLVDGRPVYTPGAVTPTNMGVGITLHLSPAGPVAPPARDRDPNLPLAASPTHSSDLGTGYVVPDRSGFTEAFLGEARPTTRLCHL